MAAAVIEQVAQVVSGPRVARIGAQRPFQNGDLLTAPGSDSPAIRAAASR